MVPLWPRPGRPEWVVEYGQTRPSRFRATISVPSVEHIARRGGSTRIPALRATRDGWPVLSPIPGCSHAGELMFSTEG